MAGSGQSKPLLGGRRPDRRPGAAPAPPMPLRRVARMSLQGGRSRMSRTLGVLSCLALAIVIASPARAQIGGHPWEVSGSAGLLHYDARAHMHDGPAFGLAAGWRFQPWLTFEANALFGPSKADSTTGAYAYDGGGAVADGPKHNFFFGDVDLRWNLRPAQSRIVPFLLTGVGVGRSRGGAGED